MTRDNPAKEQWAIAWKKKVSISGVTMMNMTQFYARVQQKRYNLFCFCSLCTLECLYSPKKAMREAKKKHWTETSYVHTVCRGKRDNTTISTWI